MTYSMSCSVSCSAAEHPLVHSVLDHIEDASRAAYDFVKSIFKFETWVDLSLSKVNIAQIRAEIDSINYQLRISSLHVETLRQALELSQDAHASLQSRHADLLNCANKAVESSGDFIRLPQEVISHIASFRYWSDMTDETQGPTPHSEWVDTVYRPALETVRFQSDPGNQLFLIGGSSASVTDSERLLSVRYRSVHCSYPFATHSRHSLLATTHRWRELHLCIGLRVHPDCWDFLNRSVDGLHSLLHLSIQPNSHTPPPTWWSGFVEQFGRMGTTFPVLRSADVPLRCLTALGDIFSKVRYLVVNVPANTSTSELSLALRDMHQLITLKTALGGSDATTNASEGRTGVIKLPTLQELTVRGPEMSTLNTTVDAFECKNLDIFHAELFEPISRPTPEEIENLLISVHDSFPILKELLFYIPESISSCSFDDHDRGPSLVIISQSVIQHLSVPAKNSRWLLPSLTTVTIPFVISRSTLRALVTLGRNRRTNHVTARLLYLKFIGLDCTEIEEKHEVVQSLRMNYHDVEFVREVVEWDW